MTLEEFTKEAEERGLTWLVRSAQSQRGNPRNLPYYVNVIDPVIFINVIGTSPLGRYGMHTDNLSDAFEQVLRRQTLEQDDAVYTA
jgi:hypothetical protein